jgi:hypothetical protein
MKKVTLSFEVLAAIVAVTILQACAGIPEHRYVPPPTLTPQYYSGPAVYVPGGVKITGTNSLFYWFDGQIGKPIASGHTVSVSTSLSPGTKLHAIAIQWHPFGVSSPVTGTYTRTR